MTLRNFLSYFAVNINMNKLIIIFAAVALFACKKKEPTCYECESYYERFYDNNPFTNHYKSQSNFEQVCSEDGKQAMEARNSEGDSTLYVSSVDHTFIFKGKTVVKCKAIN